jgi:hypothetical protein
MPCLCSEARGDRTIRDHCTIWEMGNAMTRNSTAPAAAPPFLRAAVCGIDDPRARHVYLNRAESG